MNSYKKITCWENKRRLAKLKDFQNWITIYFRNSHIEQEQVRRKINLMTPEIHKIIHASSISPEITRTPPPAVGGPILKIDLISNLFMLHQHGITHRQVLDFIEYSIGVYETDRRKSILRTMNPFWWTWRALQWLAYMPFSLIGAAGFDAARAESSIPGRLVKFLIMLVSTTASVLAILHHMDWLEDVKSIFGIGS